MNDKQTAMKAGESTEVAKVQRELSRELDMDFILDLFYDSKRNPSSKN